VADHDVAAVDDEGAELESDAVAGGGLTGNGDAGFVEVELVDADVTADAEDDGAAGGGCRGDGVGEGAGAAAVEIGDVIDVAAAAAAGEGAETLGAGEGRDLGRGLQDRTQGADQCQNAQVCGEGPAKGRGVRCPAGVGSVSFASGRRVSVSSWSMPALDVVVGL
jgi:hypothetical protein